jgi:autotransporter passenger strand-loop-strand repeat protein
VFWIRWRWRQRCQQEHHREAVSRPRQASRVPTQPLCARADRALPKLCGILCFLLEYSGATILNGGIQKVSAGGTSRDASVKSGGTEIVLAGGAAVATAASGGGTAIVSVGGAASNTIVSSGGALVVSSGGVADPTVLLSGGTETIRAGSTDDGATAARRSSSASPAAVRCLPARRSSVGAARSAMNSCYAIRNIVPTTIPCCTGRISAAQRRIAHGAFTTKTRRSKGSLLSRR